MEKNKKIWQCKYAPSLGAFEERPDDIWGVYMTQNPFPEEPCVWFGLYGLPDFYSLWRHKGKKAILWAGSDIRHFCNGYWLDEEGEICLDPHALAMWINKNCDNYVENYVEQKKLKEMGIESAVIPSFLGKIEDFPLSYKPSDKIRLYTSVSGDDFKLYGWDKIPELARANPDIEFHLYGNSTPVDFITVDNCFVHGRISKEQMNAEIKEMTGALRLTKFDGFSEIIAKSLLWGQWPVSIITYPHTFTPNELSLGIFKESIKMRNIRGREWLLSVVNRFPWNIKS